MKKLIPFVIALFVFTTVQSQEITRGPYLQSVAQESIKIMWRTDVPASSYVELALLPDGELVTTFSSEELLEDHIVLFTGLTPGTNYYYRIGTTEGMISDWNATWRFKTSTHTQEQVSFWATGDFGARNQLQIDVRDAFIEHMDGEFPDFWMWLGDNAYDDGTDEEFQERIFTPPYGYDSLLTFLPFYPVPGNHDYGSVNLFAPPPQHRGPYYDIVEVPQQAEAGGVPSGTEHYYSFDYGNAHFVAINSEAFAYTFFPGTKMEEWLREDLAATDKLWKIVYWHQPPYSKGSHDSDDFWEVFMKAMRRHYNPVVENFGVDLVLCGHSHVYERSNLIKGHYGGSGTYDPETMLVDGEQPYVKYLDGDEPNKGTMYIVQGNSGKSEDEAPGGHPIFAAESHGSGIGGSLLVEIDGSVLRGTHIRQDGEVVDEFIIEKAYRDSSVLTPVLEDVVRDFSVFPNPTSGLLQIQFNLDRSLDLQLGIYDMSGRAVHTELMSGSQAGSHTKTLQLNDYDLSTGNYVIRLATEQDGREIAYEQIVKVE